MFAWHSKHALSPTNVAPSICGGAITTRSTVEQEMTNKTRDAVPNTKAEAASQRHRFTRGPRVGGKMSISPCEGYDSPASVPVPVECLGRKTAGSGNGGSRGGFCRN